MSETKAVPWTISSDDDAEESDSVFGGRKSERSFWTVSRVTLASMSSTGG